MAEKTRYLTDQEKETAKVMYAGGKTIFQVAKTMGRSHHAIRRVVTRPEVQEEIRDIRERLIEKYQRLAEECLDRLLDEETIEKASPRDLATISGISVDKSRLLSDLSTQNLAVHSFVVNEAILLDEKSLERIAALLVRRSEDPLDDDK